MLMIMFEIVIMVIMMMLIAAFIIDADANKEVKPLRINEKEGFRF